MAKREVSPEELDAMLTQVEASAPTQQSMQVTGDEGNKDVGVYDNPITKGLALTEQVAESAIPFYDTLTAGLSTGVEIVTDMLAGTGGEYTIGEMYNQNKAMRLRYKRQAEDATGTAGSVARGIGMVGGMVVGGGVGTAARAAQMTARGAKAVKAAKAVTAMPKLKAATQAALQGRRGGATIAKYAPGVARDTAFFTGHDLDDMILNEEKIGAGTVLKSMGTNAAFSMGASAVFAGASVPFRALAKRGKIKVQEQMKTYVQDMARTYFNGSDDALRAFMDDVGIKTVPELKTFLKKHGLEKQSSYSDLAKLRNTFMGKRVVTDDAMVTTLNSIDESVEGLVSAPNIFKALEATSKKYAPQLTKSLQRKVNDMLGTFQAFSQGGATVPLADLLKMRNRLLSGEIKHGPLAKEAMEVLEQGIQRGISNAERLAKISKDAGRSSKLMKPLEQVAKGAAKKVDSLTKKVDGLVDKYTQLMRKGTEQSDPVAKELERRIKLWGKRLEKAEQGEVRAAVKMGELEHKFLVGQKFADNGKSLGQIRGQLKESGELSKFQKVVNKMTKPVDIDTSVGYQLKNVLGDGAGRTIAGMGAVGTLSGAATWYATGDYKAAILVGAAGAVGKHAFKEYQRVAVSKLMAKRDIVQPLAEVAYKKRVVAGLNSYGRMLENQAMHGKAGQRYMLAMSQLLNNPDTPDEDLATAFSSADAKVTALEKPLKLNTAQFLDPSDDNKKTQLLELLGGPSDVGGDRSKQEELSNILKDTGQSKVSALRHFLDNMRKDDRYEAYFEKGDTIDGIMVDPQQIQETAKRAFTDNVQVPFLVRKQIVDQFIQSGDVGALQQMIQETTRQPVQYVPNSKFIY